MKIGWPRLAGKFAGKFAGNKTNGERIAIMKSGDRLDLVASLSDQLVAAESSPCTDLDSINPLLADFCQRHGVSDPLCTVLMSPGSYQLLLVEAPPVEQSELADALRWKAKDLLQAPVEETIVDGFLLPEDAYRGRQKMAYTVATGRDGLQSLVDQLVRSGMRVDKIDIPELALLQLLELCSPVGQAEMILLPGRDSGFLAVVADSAIYLVRNLDISGEQLSQLSAGAIQAGDSALENLVLEMQRSRDYFESQVGKGVVARVLLLPSSDNAPLLAGAIGERLGLDVALLDSSALGGPALPENTLAGAAAETLLLAGAVKAA